MRMNFHLIAGLFQQFPHPAVRLRCLTHPLDRTPTKPVVGNFEFRRPGDKPIGRIPGSLLGLFTNNLQAHAELNVIPPPVFRGTLADIADLLCDNFRLVTPEKMDRRMLRRNLQRIFRPTPEEEGRCGRCKGFGSIACVTE
jgi:hypothetical protein